jgi:dipeptidyl aminopeptidase/acylaminoacyl peptidase
MGPIVWRALLPACLLPALLLSGPAHALSPLPTNVESKPLQLEQIMADPAWIGAPVESPHWSLDGRSALFQLKRADSPLRDLHRVGFDGTAMVKLDDAALATVDAPNPVFDASGRQALLIRDGDVFVRDLASGTLRQLTRSEIIESQPDFMADGRVMYRAGADWIVHDLNAGLAGPLVLLKVEKDPAEAPKADDLRDMQLRLIATLAREKAWRDGQRERDAELRRGVSGRQLPPVFLGDSIAISDSALSPDGRWMLVVTQPKSAEPGRAGKMPKYVTESGYEESEDVRPRVGRNLPAGQALVLVDLTDGSQHPLDLKALPGIEIDPLAELRAAAGKDPLKGPRDVRVNAIEFSADGAQAAVMLRSVDNKDRWIAVVERSGRRLDSRHRLTDPAWINWSFNEFGWLPDGQTLWYLSEEDGYSHLYTRRGDARARQHTEGRFEFSEPVISRDGRHVYGLANQAWPGKYEVVKLDLRSNRLSTLTDLGGVEGFVLSPDEKQLLVHYSQPHLPQQLGLISAEGGAFRSLTDTRSADFRAQAWLQPEFVQVPSKHGAGTVWGKLYRPTTLEPGKRYPIALFVHGAGYLQNVHQRWPNYFREQMFHQLLVENGYIVLDLDFRASAGYGRDWRTAIYRQMGHPELEDYLDGIDWLVEHQQGDRGKVGIYGGSYGGFMAFMAMFRAPEAFHAGAALRPVTDWSQYNHPYTANILNTPDIDPEAYAKSSPIELAEGLQGHLLISHGMIDDNVLYQDSIRLAQRLIELRKDNWELASYPLERHGYVHPEAWFDQYRRIFKLFERALK